MNLNELGGEPLARCATREKNFSSPVARLPEEEFGLIVIFVGDKDRNKNRNGKD